MQEELFTQSCRELDTEFNRLGLLETFRFLTSSKDAFRTDIPALILDKPPSSNPFGSNDPPYSCEQGSAYFVECWGQGVPAGQEKIQRRMRLFLRDLQNELHIKMPADAFAVRGVLSAYYDPFRNGKGCKKFLSSFWGKILDAIHPPLLFAFAQPAYAMLCDYFKTDQSGKRLSPEERIATQGNFSLKIREASHGTQTSLIVFIPSLSRYAYGLYEKLAGNIRKEAEKHMWERMHTFLAKNYN